MYGIGQSASPRHRAANQHLLCCLDGLVRAGWSDIHLFMDGTVRVPRKHSHLPTTWREHAVGACPAWLFSFAELVSLHPDADAYAMIQDDVFPHYGDSLREYLEDALWPNRSDVLVSLYNPGLVTRRGWHKLPSDWDWGTLAVVFPPQLARDFLSDANVVRRSLPAEAGATSAHSRGCARMGSPTANQRLVSESEFDATYRTNQHDLGWRKPRCSSQSALV